jgi:hypothetical protein
MVKGALRTRHVVKPPIAFSVWMKFMVRLGFRVRFMVRVAARAVAAFSVR